VSHHSPDLDQGERRFLLFHVMPPPVERYLVRPDDDGRLMLIAIKTLPSKKASDCAIPFSSYQRIASYFLADLSVDVVALAQLTRETADVCGD